MPSDEGPDECIGRVSGEAGPLRSAKLKGRVSIPEDLRGFLTGVHDQIVGEDDATTIPSDDLLQDENVFGGLDDCGDRYSFTYFPGPGTSIRWRFTLLANEIEEIAEGGMDQLSVEITAEQ